MKKKKLLSEDGKNGKKNKRTSRNSLSIDISRPRLVRICNFLKNTERITFYILQKFVMFFFSSSTILFPQKFLYSQRFEIKRKNRVLFHVNLLRLFFLCIILVCTYFYCLQFIFVFFFFAMLCAIIVIFIEEETLMVMRFKKRIARN